MRDIKISIIVPIYNIKGYLEKCIESIINQSYRNMEIILIDDGSTDGCYEICDYYAQKDSRICVIHKNNGGLVSARKAGTDIATGDYILNVDGDDWIEEDRVDALVRDGIMPSQADMIYLAGHQRDFEGNNVFIKDDIPIKTFYDEDIRKQVFPLFYYEGKAFKRGIIRNVWAWAIRADLLKKNQRAIDDRIIMGEDVICIWFCLMEAKSVTFIKHSGYHYIQRKSSLVYSAPLSENILSVKVWYAQFKKHLEECNVSREISRLFFWEAIYIIISANYRILLRKHSDYLFPFPKVRSGCRVIVYGAGRIGYSLMYYLSSVDDYKVVLWVDKNKNRPVIPGWEISTAKDIGGVDYDYIVVAVLNAEMAEEIKKSLIYQGIPEEKIATMEPSVITEDAIPDEIKYW